MSDVDPIAFLERAVETPSHEDVGEMRALLVETLEAAGLDPTVDDGGNVLATRGEGRPRVVLNTHLDTVAPHVPLDRDGERVRGRGACDAKGPLAAMLDAFVTVDPPGRLTIAVTPDEETDSRGVGHLDLDPDAVVVGEPTDLDACVAARGRYQGTVTIEGVGAHAADPAAGVNAITSAAPILAAMDGFDSERGPAPHPRLGPPSLVPTRIEGGEATNRVPAETRITFDRRSVPPETADRFFSSLQTHLREVVGSSATVTVSGATRETPFLEAFETDPEAAVVRALESAGAGDPRAFGAATEASIFAERAPTVVFGPGHLVDEEGPVAHAEREYVEIESVRRAGAILTEAIETLGD
ncbi:MAG: M20 family metallopeptidase [Halanaeroarchaeum sp.]